MNYVRGILHYMDGHIHVVLYYTVECIFDQVIDMDPNDMHADMYELHMKEDGHMVVHIRLLLNDKEPFKKMKKFFFQMNMKMKIISLTLLRTVCSPTHFLEIRCVQGGHSSSL